ncbi:MAG: hypothetical protein OER88_10175, partial [Planctomycetota bacterium]|nr:hypothetical protein [Planctomycetota bacterium]
VEKGDVVAHENGAPVHSIVTGRILMPRYQSEGTDGFFLVQGVGPWKLRLGRWVRRLKLDYFLPWVWPGVKRVRADLPTLRVRGGTPGAMLAAILRAFGYRRRHADDGDMIYVQRRG